jgi:hypothetical protein
MKRLAMVLLCSLSVSPATVAASGTWQGKISDSRCASSHKNGPSTGGQILNDVECSELCVEAGAKFVLVTDNGVYAIANQDFKGLRANMDKMVQLDGDLKDTTLTVTKITPVPKKTSKKK